MRQEAIGEAVQAFICMSIWEDTGFQERQTNNVIVNVMSILTIIEQADTVSPFAQINPSMSTGLKSREIPRCVTVCGAFNVAKLDFIRCSRTVDCQRKRRLQQRLVLVPRSEEHTSELQSQSNLVCRLLLEKQNKKL